MNILNQLKSKLVTPKAQDFHDRAEVSLSIFGRVVEDLKKLNEEAKEHKVLHEQIIEDSKKELQSVEALFTRNNKVIDKINEIIL